MSSKFTAPNPADLSHDQRTAILRDTYDILLGFHKGITSIIVTLAKQTIANGGKVDPEQARAAIASITLGVELSTSAMQEAVTLAAEGNIPQPNVARPKGTLLN